MRSRSPRLVACLRSITLPLLLLGWVSLGFGQDDVRHFQQWGDQPPGVVGRMQVGRGGPLAGYYQPVEVFGPKGSHVTLWDGEEALKFEKHQGKAGLLVGEVYQARITRIPDHAGFEVYPTIEVINRLYPPAGQEVRFPIPVHVTQEDIERALAGQFVIRVVYLEDPSIALPARQREGEQRSVDVGPGEDPLIAADELGRPMAIVRIGARVPDHLMGAGPTRPLPPLQRYDQPQDQNTVTPAGLTSPQQ